MESPLIGMLRTISSRATKASRSIQCAEGIAMLPKSSADPQLARCEPVAAPCGRDPEDRLVPPSPQYIRDKMLDKTIADSFPTSDPPSSLPDPSMDDSFATEEEKQLEQQLCSEQL